MPLYPFKCSCGTIYECFMHVEDYKIPDCPECGEHMKRVFSPSATHFFEERWHSGIGAHVKSRHHLHEVMKRKEEEYEARVGIPIKYSEP